MAQIIDFPAARIKRVIFMEPTHFWSGDEREQAFSWVRTLLRNGYPARDAVTLSIELAREA